MVLALDLGKFAIPVVLLVIGVAVLKAIVRRQEKKRSTPLAEGSWPYRVRKLLTQPEQVLFDRVRSAVPDHLVFAQVQLSRVLEVPNRPDSTSWFNRVSQLSIDLLVCAPDTTPVLAIELDDASHERARQQERDGRKTRACQDAGLKLIRWNVRSMPNVDTIRQAVGLTSAPSAAVLR